MGKTRIAVEVARCVIGNGGRVAMLVPPGLGYQWQAELRDGEVNDVPADFRSLSAYLAWADNQQPWFAKQAVMVSHAFTNWRIGSNSRLALGIGAGTLCSGANRRSVVSARISRQ